MRQPDDAFFEKAFFETGRKKDRKRARLHQKKEHSETPQTNFIDMTDGV